MAIKRFERGPMDWIACEIKTIFFFGQGHSRESGPGFKTGYM